MLSRSSFGFGCMRCNRRPGTCQGMNEPAGPVGPAG